MAKTTSTHEHPSTRHTRNNGKTEKEERWNKSARRKIIKSDPETIGGEWEHASDRRFITRPEVRVSCRSRNRDANGGTKKAHEHGGHRDDGRCRPFTRRQGGESVRPAKYSPRTKNIEQRLWAVLSDRLFSPSLSVSRSKLFVVPLSSS